MHRYYVKKLPIRGANEYHDPDPMFKIVGRISVGLGKRAVEPDVGKEISLQTIKNIVVNGFEVHIYPSDRNRHPAFKREKCEAGHKILAASEHEFCWKCGIKL